MSDTIVWRRDDDSVAITQCPPGFRPEEWQNELIARAKADQEAAARGEIHVPEGHVLASAQFLVEEPVAINPPIPSYCEFRNAMVWDHAGKKVVHHMGRAREIRRGHLRREREEAFKPLDAAYNIAHEKGDTKELARIAKARQALRDITRHPDIENATTLDALRAVKLPG